MPTVHVAGTQPEVWTVGHSTHTSARFIELLTGHGVQTVADIRTSATSRRHPQFDAQRLAEWLPAAGIRYAHIPRLGGRRRPTPDSPNGGWHVEAFRGYADYALGDEFATGLDELVALAGRAPTAMMCSEALWWRCHRRLVADRLVVLGHIVVHIGSDGRGAPHRLTPFAAPQPGGRVIYPTTTAPGAASSPRA